MGTINYYTSNYVTIGFNIDNNYFDEEGADGCFDGDCYDYDFEEDCYKQATWTREKIYFYYFSVQVKPGYYRGFSIDIEPNFPLCFDDYRDKMEAQKEVTIIKKFLLDCVNDFNCCAVSPGWCTAYYNRAETLQKIGEAVKQMRAEILATPTYNQLKLAGEL